MAASGNSPVKILCSYGGKILPRHSDGKLRYIGGETRVLSVDRLIQFQDLILKLNELYGSAVYLRCQLPTEDLDALIAITNDEDLFYLMAEYDKANKEKSTTPLKIRAFLFPLKQKSEQTSAPVSSQINRCDHQITPLRLPVKSSVELCYYPCFSLGNTNTVFLVHHGNNCQEQNPRSAVHGR